MTVPFGKLLPDSAAFRLLGEVTAKNVVPIQGSYGPLRELVVAGTALTSRVLGAGLTRTTGRAAMVFAGDATKLYQISPTAGFIWEDVSRAAGYSLTSEETWEFAPFLRNNKMIATGPLGSPPQSIIPTAAGAVDFANMITSTLTPSGRTVAIINNFVVLGHTKDAVDGERPWRVWWSAFGDETDFDPDAATQCDYEDLASGDGVQRIIGGTDYGLVFQQEQVQTMRYSGGGTIFEFYPVNYAPGTPIPRSVIAYKGRAFYIAPNGFMAISAGQAESIGSAQIDKYFWDQFNLDKRRGVSAAIDPYNKTVVWAFPGTGVGAEVEIPNRALAYKWDENRWAEWEIDVELLFLSKDVAVGSAGTTKLSAFDTAHKLGGFTGATRKGTIITGDLQPADGQRWQLNGVRPLVDGGTVDISSAPRTRLKDTVTYGTAAAMSVDGVCPLRTEGRYQRLQCSITSSTSWNHFQGLQLDYELEGEA